MQDQTNRTREEWDERLRSLWQTTREKEGKYNKVKNFIDELLKSQKEATKKRFIDFIDAHYLEHCRTQNGRPYCKNCGICLEDLEELLRS